ncbi:ATP-binding cassette domain-containing protein [Algoriphagus sp. NF]|mgnify:FL=1|jgi:ABC-type transport system involved in resistance to organic solvents, ATPase component|uniref:ATP-binding cassette domain-containing protein n=1 Tax=Algoriphagus formosus TaxID=2007308 RepID=A0A4R5UVV5_9BACT|nr:MULTISPECIES: ATP-binding cassette domain-containing protein [Algoriphagus]MDE0560407.1 ATP-binding cassette domain-containing protein [Algoriphagus sp. NF]TDK43400.1 ATP-binding cassette domain-containing protein [Algoriphagus aquimaris]
MIKDKAIIEVDRLNKSFGQNHVLRDFSLQLSEGENLVILGKSGSGKSVLIKCIIRLIEPDSGTISILDQDISLLDQDEMDLLRADVGFLFQSNALYDSMTIRQNLEFPLRRHWTKEERELKAESAVKEALEDVGLLHTIDMMPAELSGGMRKRIALARTIILKPKVILYDEPTTGLDPITGREISELMNRIQEKYNTASIIISHDMNCIRMTANRIIMLIEGRNYAEGTFENLIKNQDPKVGDFFEGL